MKGLFIQVSTYDFDEFDRTLDLIRDYYPEVGQLVFTNCPLDFDLAEFNLTGFDIALGASPVPWLGAAREDTPELQEWMLPFPGVAGMLTESYRWEQIAADIALSSNHPAAGLYIGNEVDLISLGEHPQLRAAWEAYLLEVRRSTDKPLIWSPYVWDQWSKVSSTKRATMAKALGLLDAALPNALNLHLQDGRGAQPGEPLTDIPKWYDLLIRAMPHTLCHLNMELFTPEYLPISLDEFNSRHRYYDDARISVGVCWELRYLRFPATPLPEPEEDMRPALTDALREIQKLLSTLEFADRHFWAEGEANAALHLNPTVMPNPLAAHVAISLRDGRIAHDRLTRILHGETPLPFEP